MSWLYNEFNLDDAIAVAREEAWEDGQRENTLEIARNALMEGSSPEFVQKITGLDLDTLKNLQAGL
jgi:hypothetical protein